MHFYDYWTPEETTEHPAYLAAASLIEVGFQIIPIKKGDKFPSGNIRSVSEIRQRPLHKHNISYYFERDVDIAIMLRRNIEVIDVDSKHKAGLSEAFLSALERGWPELYDKLTISKTPSGGLHVLYFSDVVGGKRILAGKDNGEGNTIALIERLNESNKDYIKVCPSAGYAFIKGNPMEMPTLTAEERNWLSAFAASFDTFPIPQIHKREAKREDSPYNVFNQQKNWNYTLDELKERNWTVVNDLNNKIVLKFPGAVQHSGALWKDSNTLWLYTTNSEFLPEKPYSPFDIYCFYYHDGNVATACAALAKDGIGVNKFDEGEFWIKVGKKIKIKYTELCHWLHSVGYRTYQNEIVKITDNIISISEDKKLKAVFLRELEPEIVDDFFERVSTVFSEQGGLMAMLKPLEDNFIQDTQKETWLFFKNYAVKITETDILPMQYKEVKGYIWENSIIDRNFYNAQYTGCDAERFVNILGGDKAADLKKLIGYTVSRYKDPINPRAVVLIEDIDADDEGESQGGSGKGLLFSFVRYFRKVADFDGKNFKTTDTFLYQNVEPDTNILFIDDVERHFKFTSLFSIITGVLLVNKKNKPQVSIPYDKSPKIFITSNFSVGNMDISSRRRKYEFAVVKHFGEDLEPIDEFGRQFFTGWDEEEWCKFDNFIADCCLLYLSDKDKKRIGNVTENSTERSLISNTNKDFIDYMDGQLECNFFDFAPVDLKTAKVTMNNGTTVTNAVDVQKWFNNACSSSPRTDLYLTMSKEDFSNKMTQILKLKTISTTKITQWLKRWSKSRNVVIDTKYRRGANLEMCYRVVEFKVNNEVLKVNNEQIESEHAPF